MQPPTQLELLASKLRPSGCLTKLGMDPISAEGRDTMLLSIIVASRKMSSSTDHSDKNSNSAKNQLFKRIIRELEINPNDDNIKIAALLILSKLNLTLTTAQKTQFFEAFTIDFCVRLLHDPHYNQTAIEMLEIIPPELFLEKHKGEA